MAGKDKTFALPGDMGDRGTLKPGDEIVSGAHNIRTVYGERCNGPTQDMPVQLVEDDLDFRELRHRGRRGESKRVERAWVVFPYGLEGCIRFEVALGIAMFIFCEVSSWASQ